MELSRYITIHFSEDDVKRIILQHLNSYGYYPDIEDIELNVGRRTEGYGMAEHDVLYFEGCDVEIVSERKEDLA